MNACPEFTGVELFRSIRHLKKELDLQAQVLIICRSAPSFELPFSL